MSVERSAELLRQALPLMSRQTAALHPVSYAIWFEYVARMNAPLCAAIDEHLARDGALDEITTRALYRRHVADVDPEAAQRVVDGLQRVLGALGEAAGSTGAHVGRFGSSLARLAGALERGDTVRGIGEDSAVVRNGPPPRLLADVVAEVIADTGTMRTQLGGLQQRLADSRREVERLREEVRRAREEALRDSLTGLANRRGFDQAVAACLLARADGGAAAASAAGGPPTPAAASAASAIDAIQAAMAPSASRPPAGPGAVDRPAPAAPAAGAWLLMSGIDHFDRINEAYGSGFGDEVLKVVAEALRGLAPPGSTVARVDGEAFALLVPEADAVGAHALAERVRRHVGSARIRRPGRDEAERVTLSLGLAAHRTGDTAAAFVERAGAAMRKARLNGRDRVETLD